ncbi:uncharacterized protein LOC106162814 [Lingula anatina]|uniref:Uncharacterized protein LOC106162814 n=1 Tax=Lingula anatina TaxID=7574 RepID=A0A1S3IBQ8_LINAN|nr:uncharacterized protein LOC106162814 [Lingula anatina]|eukprot:XP_013395690.1 uncharacterized protein LOC106162814 [Lingula anatina]
MNSDFADSRKMDEEDGEGVSTKKAAYGRGKSTKSMLERKRRARINACLAQLKVLIKDHVREQGFRPAKMDKADVLEMTVKYLKILQRAERGNDFASDHISDAICRYRAGFSECVNEVLAFLGRQSTDPIDSAEFKAQLVNHLATNNTRNSRRQLPQLGGGLLSLGGEEDVQLSQQLYRYNFEQQISIMEIRKGRGSIEYTDDIRSAKATKYANTPSVPTPRVSANGSGGDGIFVHTTETFSRVSRPSCPPETPSLSEQFLPSSPSSSDATCSQSFSDEDRSSSASDDVMRANETEDGSVWRPWGLGFE